MTKEDAYYNLAFKESTVRFIKIILLLFSVPFYNFSNAQTTITIDQIVYDMVGDPVRDDMYFKAPWGANEGFPHGLPTNWDWYNGARPNRWMDTSSNKALSCWGQIFEWKEGSPVTDVRFQIRNHQMYVFSNGLWVLAEDVSNDIEAGLFKESNYSWAGLISSKNEKNNGGGVSYSIKPNYCLHWFKQVWGDKKRYKLPEDFEAIYIRFEIKMIPDINKSTSVADAKYLAAVGADYYPFPESGGIENNPSLAISRHKFLSANWQTFTVYIAGSLPTNVREFKEEILSRPLPPNVINSELNQK